jgi:hypothetical protein
MRVWRAALGVDVVRGGSPWDSSRGWYTNLLEAALRLRSEVAPETVHGRAGERRRGEGGARSIVASAQG